ncbi:beta-galactosidase 15-like [Brassica napus]|uniref:beta-galactosidase 15-like n=1 Tax=Brassica napus TaxID=3708 RepID=UPI00207916EC|nr:beta-galactosidase 15-like [Brassica napus]
MENLLGNLSQPKCGHLKQLYDVLHSIKKTLTYGNISTIDFGNSASITTQTSMMVKKSNEAEDTPSTLKWSWRPKNMDNFLLKGKEESTQTQLFDQKVVTNDQSDYLCTAHVLHAFVNGKNIGNQHVENGKFNYVFEKDVKFKSGRNVIALLSITVGLANYGAFFESKPAGITGPIFITGINGDETIVKNLSAHKWSYKTGLNGFDNQLFRTEEMSKWSVENATFKSPLGNDPVVVDLMGLGKEGDNTPVLFEEMGGNQSLVSFQTTRVGSVCANVYEKTIIELSCDRKPVFAIKFASFGNPDGNCGSFEKGTCESSKNTADILTQECVGKEKCSIDVSTEKFGAPDCSSAPRRLAIEAIC